MLGADKIQRLTFKTAFNCTQQLQKSHMAQPARHVWSWEKKPPNHCSFVFCFFLFPNKQKIEHQSESNSATSWTPSPWKASLHHATLKESTAISPCQLAPKLLA
jgi:hypothetical protein